MSEALRKLFKRLPNGTPATVSDLEKKLRAAEAELTTAQELANAAYLDADPAANELQARVNELRSECERLRGATALAAERVSRNKEIAAAEQTEAAWRSTEKLLSRRADLSVEMEVTVLRLADQFKELASLNGEIYRDAPIRIGRFYTSPLSTGEAETALRLFLVRCGFAWAASYPWGADKIAPFSEKIKAGNREILARRPKVEVGQ